MQNFQTVVYDFLTTEKDAKLHVLRLSMKNWIMRESKFAPVVTQR